MAKKLNVGNGDFIPDNKNISGLSIYIFFGKIMLNVVTLNLNERPSIINSIKQR